MAVSRALSSSTRRLEGKVAIVAAGASGIGESAARLFGRHGAKVLIADVHSERGQRVCEEITVGGDLASYRRCDDGAKVLIADVHSERGQRVCEEITTAGGHRVVSDEADVEAAVHAAVSSRGRLDVMFNNAGTITAYGPLINIEASDVRKVMDVNVMGVFFGIKLAGRAMVSAGSGSIINKASGVASMASLTVAHYTASKQAVVGITKDAAVELGRGGVRVNCVSPHLLASPLACKYLGDAERIEAAVEKSSVQRAEDIAEALSDERRVKICQRAESRGRWRLHVHQYFPGRTTLSFCLKCSRFSFSQGAQLCPSLVCKRVPPVRYRR